MLLTHASKETLSIIIWNVYLFQFYHMNYQYIVHFALFSDTVLSNWLSSYSQLMTLCYLPIYVVNVSSIFRFCLLLLHYVCRILFICFSVMFTISPKRVKWIWQKHDTLAAVVFVHQTFPLIVSCIMAFPWNRNKHNKLLKLQAALAGWFSFLPKYLLIFFLQHIYDNVCTD